MRTYQVCSEETGALHTKWTVCVAGGGQEPDGRTDGWSHGLVVEEEVLKQNLIKATSVSPRQVLGMIHWALVASTPYVHAPAYGWVMFVAVTLWLLTIGFFFVSLFSLNRMLSIPWALVVGELYIGPYSGSEEP